MLPRLDWLSHHQVVGSVRPPFYRINLSFFGKSGTRLGLNRLGCEGRKRGDCKLRSDDFAEWSYNDGTGFQSTAFGIDCRPSSGKRAHDTTSSVVEKKPTLTEVISK